MITQEKKIKLAIIGSREFPRFERVIEYLDSVIEIFISIQIITGGARGVDTVAYNWAIKNNVSAKIIGPKNPAEKISYLFRNIEIIMEAHQVVAFWDGKSKGTKFVIDYCKFRNIPIKVFEP